VLTRADLNEISPVCLFPAPKETITEIKIRIVGGRKIEIFGSGGPTPLDRHIPHPSRTNFGLRLVYRVGLGLVFISV